MRRNGYQPTSNNLGNTPPSANSNVHTPHCDLLPMPLYKPAKIEMIDVKIIKQETTNEFEMELKKFIREHNVIDIQYSFTSEAPCYFTYSALLIYEKESEDE